MRKLVTFGEIMLRLSPESGHRLFQNGTMRTCFGGSEANVAALCAQLGIPSSFVTKIPKNEIGDGAVRHLSGLGVDTSLIVRGGDRLGVYYYEKGACERPSKCIYDRAGSAFAGSGIFDYDAGMIFADAAAFHLSGITPALSENMPDICISLCKEARARGLLVSYDLNHRSKLWDEEKNKEESERILPYVDLFISNMYQANSIFSIGADTASEESACITVARTMMKRYDIKTVALTVRKTLSADENGFYGMIYDGENAYFSKKYVTGIVDRVGSGDAFDGALIASVLKGSDMQTAVEYAVAAAVLKHSIEGDTAYLSDSEIKALAAGADGRVQR